jgi:hypothetical protein
MAFELQRKPMPARLAEAFEGATAELRELDYGELTEAMQAGGTQKRATESLLGASLHVDGGPVGLERVLRAPGRFAGAISDAVAEVIRLHGLVRADADAEPEQATQDEAATAPKH